MRNGSIRPYKAQHVKENVGSVSGRRFTNELFSNCEIGPSRGAEFIHCTLTGSKFVSEDVRDFIGMTLTINCQTFEKVELPEIAFDAFIKLLSITAGNDEKRQKLREIINPRTLEFLDRAFPSLE